MTIARVENNSVIEYRNLTLDDVPEHKRAVWRTIEGDAPTADRRYYTVSGPTYQIEAERVLRVWNVAARDLATVKAEAKARISTAAEVARNKYITPGSGKAMSYQEVAEEAKRHLATGGAGDYPFLQARVASGRYATLVAARDGTLALEAQWAIVGAAIDEIEDRAKLQIDAAQTVEAVRAAEQVTWP